MDTHEIHVKSSKARHVTIGSAVERNAMARLDDILLKASTKHEESLGRAFLTFFKTSLFAKSLSLSFASSLELDLRSSSHGTPLLCSLSSFVGLPLEEKKKKKESLNTRREVSRTPSRNFNVTGKKRRSLYFQIKSEVAGSRRCLF